MMLMIGLAIPFPAAISTAMAMLMSSSVLIELTQQEALMPVRPMSSSAAPLLAGK